MLVCSQCHAENPSDRRFCTKCGAPLPRVDAEPAEPSVTPVWYATLQPLTQNDGRSLPPYLDPQQRYRPVSVRRSRDRRDAAPPVIETRVYDLAPESPPYRSSDAPDIAPLLPESAQPYLHPYCAANSALPRLHDTWQSDRYAVVLLEDRSQRPSLLHAWSAPPTTAVQRLYWMYQMTDLWMLLAELACRPSLTELHNLRLDGDRIICLQQLHRERPGTPSSLKALGYTWNALYRAARVTPEPDIAQTLVQVESGRLPTPDRLRSQLDRLLEQFGTSQSEAEDDDDQTGWNFDEDDNTVTAPIRADLHLSAAGKTDIGRQRRHNEDTFWMWTQQETQQTPDERSQRSRGIYVLCDGMGGHDGGEIASAIAVDTLTEALRQQWGASFPSEDDLRAAIHSANRAIYDFNQERQREGSGRMGTTLVVLLVEGDRAAVAHVGDSRLYALSLGGGLQRLTTDHEVGQQAIARGIDPAMAYRRPEAYQLTQAIGPRETVRPDVRFFTISEDTLFLLASDGLTDRDLVEHHWQTHLKPYLNPSTSLDRATADLVELANRENGRDNVTTVLVRTTVETMP